MAWGSYRSDPRRPTAGSGPASVSHRRRQRGMTDTDRQTHTHTIRPLYNNGTGDVLCAYLRAGELSDAAGSSQGESGLYPGDRSRYRRQLGPTCVSTELQRRLRVHHDSCRYCRYSWKHYHLVWYSDGIPLASSASEHHATLLLRYQVSTFNLLCLNCQRCSAVEFPKLEVQSQSNPMRLKMLKHTNILVIIRGV